MNAEHPASNAEQAELRLGAKVRRDEAQIAEDVWRMEVLLGHSGADGARWLKAAEICTALGWPGGDAGKRYIRRLAEKSHLILSFPGSPGYTLIALAGDEDLRHAANAIAAQVAVMQAKRVRLENILGLRHAAQKLGDVPFTGEHTSGALAAYLAGE